MLSPITCALMMSGNTCQRINNLGDGIFAFSVEQARPQVIPTDPCPLELFGLRGIMGIAASTSSAVACNRRPELALLASLVCRRMTPFGKFAAFDNLKGEEERGDEAARRKLLGRGGGASSSSGRNKGPTSTTDFLGYQLVYPEDAGIANAAVAGPIGLDDRPLPLYVGTSGNRILGGVLLHQTRTSNDIEALCRPRRKGLPGASRRGEDLNLKLSYWCEKRRYIEQYGGPKVLRAVQESNLNSLEPFGLNPHWNWRSRLFRPALAGATTDYYNSTEVLAALASRSVLHLCVSRSPSVRPAVENLLRFSTYSGVAACMPGSSQCRRHPERVCGHPHTRRRGRVPCLRGLDAHVAPGSADADLSRRLGVPYRKDQGRVDADGSVQPQDPRIR